MSVITAINLVIHKGTDFEEEFDLTEDNGFPLNLDGYSAAAKVRKHPSAKRYVPFVVDFIDRSLGKIKISLTNDQTLQLKSGRNYYDLILIDGSDKIRKVVEGSIIVHDTASIGVSEDGSLDALGDVDIRNLEDGYVLMYDLPQNKYVFVDPDEILSAATNTNNALPQDFLNQLDTDLDNRIDLDSGEFPIDVDSGELPNGN
jgi:hypothetical protein